MIIHAAHKNNFYKTNKINKNYKNVLKIEDVYTSIRLNKHDLGVCIIGI